MDEFKKMIFNDMNNIINQINNSNIDDAPYLCSDLNDLFIICDNFGITDYPKIDLKYLNSELEKLDDNAIQTTINSYTKDPSFILNIIYNIYKFYRWKGISGCDYNNLSTKLAPNESYQLAKDFYSSFDKRYLDVFNKLYDNKRIRSFESSDDELFGITEYGISYLPYVFYTEFNNILTATTIIHEIAHAYCAIEQQKLGYQKMYHSILINTVEIPPYTIELFFYDYLNKIGFNKNDVNLLYNIYSASLKVIAKDCYCNYYRKKNFKDNDINLVNSQISTLYGKALGIYLYSLNNKEKAINLIDIINIESCSKILPDIIKDNNMDYDDIVSFESGSKLILKKWSK